VVEAHEIRSHATLPSLLEGGNMVGTICPSWIEEMHDISVARGAEITFGRGVPPISIVASGSTIHRRIGNAKYCLSSGAKSLES